ncbi:IclR family transcriptional regulator [Methylobacterium aquaticum]|uniref:IclR family transcriptional regulator n=1 Tax=Methylobacterium aquaticum TaxID=270351 RepID=UPI003D180F98
MRPRKERGDDEGQDRDFVAALARGLEILRAFRREGEALGNGDFAERTGLSKSTVSRLTYTLHKLDYLSWDPATARYRLAPPVLSLGFSCLAGMPLRQIAKPYMQELADYTGMPVALASPDRLSMVYLERCRGANAVTLAIEVGAHIKMATTAVGRAYLAVLPPDQRAALFEQLEKHEGAAWVDMRRGIEAAIECYQERGYCMSLTEWKPDVNAVAVALAPRDGSPVMAFNCGGPSQSLTRDWIETDVAPRLVDLVRRVSAVAH